MKQRIRSAPVIGIIYLLALSSICQSWPAPHEIPDEVRHIVSTGQVAPGDLIAICTGRDRSEANKTNKRLQDRAVSVLRKNFLEQTGWVRVHAAEALLWHCYPQGVREIFLPQSDTAPPKHRIGVWRVLAQASRGKQRQQYIDRIEKAFLDFDGPDRGHAVESLMKLGYKKRPDALVQMSKDESDLLAPYARGTLANSGNLSDESHLAALLDSAVIAQRSGTAYALRFRPQVSPPTLTRVKKAALEEADDSPARVYLFSTWFVHASQNERLTPKEVLLEYIRTGNKDQKYQACAALGMGRDTKDLLHLTRILEDNEADIRVSAAEAILRIIKNN